MSSRRVFTFLVNALAMVLVAVGCGGSGGETMTSSLSRTEFIKKADAVCKRGGERLKADFAIFAKEKNNNPNPSQAEYEELIAQVIAPNVNQEVAELRALGSPTGDEGEVEAMLAATEEGVRKSEEHPTQALTVDQFAKAAKFAKAYGLKVCGSTR